MKSNDYHCEFSRSVCRTREGIVVCRLQLIHSGYLNNKHSGGSRGAGTKATEPQETKKGSPLLQCSACTELYLSNTAVCFLNHMDSKINYFIFDKLLS